MEYKEQNKIKMYGELDVIVQDLKGNVKRKYQFHNDIVSNITADGIPNGTAIVAGYLTGEVRGGINVMRVGTGTGATTDNTFELNPVEPGRFAVSRINRTATQAVFQAYTLDAQLSNKTYTEFGFYVNRGLFSRIVNTPGVRKAAGGKHYLAIYS